MRDWTKVEHIIKEKNDLWILEEVLGSKNRSHRKFSALLEIAWRISNVFYAGIENAPKKFLPYL